MDNEQLKKSRTMPKFLCSTLISWEDGSRHHHLTWMELNRNH
jgi:hypothetical protein